MKSNSLLDSLKSWQSSFPSMQCGDQFPISLGTLVNEVHYQIFAKRQWAAKRTRLASPYLRERMQVLTHAFLDRVCKLGTAVCLLSLGLDHSELGLLCWTQSCLRLCQYPLCHYPRWLMVPQLLMTCWHAEKVKERKAEPSSSWVEHIWRRSLWSFKSCSILLNKSENIKPCQKSSL